MRTSLVFLDTETTGLQPDQYTPWEIAWRTAIHDSQERTLEVYVERTMFIELTPDELKDADFNALRIGRYHERFDPTSALAPKAAYDLLAADLKDIAHEAWDQSTQAYPLVPHLVGAIPSFDHAHMCMNYFGWPGFGEGVWHYHLIDVEALSVGFHNGQLFHGPASEFHERAIMWPVNSDRLSAATGVYVNQSVKHTAAGDVGMAYEMYRKCFGLSRPYSDGFNK